MKNIAITSFADFFNQVQKTNQTTFPVRLYRGQNRNWDLLPSIARKNNLMRRAKLEKEVFDDFNRRAGLLMDRGISSDWEKLIYAQHYGLKTRLLDWTSNPLAALWFACYDIQYKKEDSFVYILVPQIPVYADVNLSPFDIRQTQILRPFLNNPRIVAQSGWFTIHSYSGKAKKFVPININPNYKDDLTEIMIPHMIKEDLLHELSILGVNYSTIFPDLSGLCSHLNWSYNL